MSSYFEQADQMFKNACKSEFQLHRISNCEPIEELIRESNRWFISLKDLDEDYAKQLRIKIWRLSKTLIFTLLPFDSEDLHIRDNFNNLFNEAQYFPFLRERVIQLEKITDYLLRNPENMKRNKVFSLLVSGGRIHEKIGLVTALSRGFTPGWPEILVAEIRRLAPKCSLINSAKVLKNSTYDQILLTASARFSPLLQDLFYGCRTKLLDMVIYKGEGFVRPEKKCLPKEGKLFPTDTRIAAEIPDTEKVTDDVIVDEWIRMRFWESLRKTTSGNDQRDIEKGREFLVRARLVLLPGERKIFLQEDVHVIEISDLIDGASHIDEYGNKYPRKNVNELKEGDLIVLRTSGSGDYLIDVANAMLKAEKKDHLLITAMDWKETLEGALKKHGHDAIAGMLKSKGFQLSDPRYVWMWTTDLVIRPKNESNYAALMAILRDLNYKVNNQCPTDLISTRWQQMEEIIHYRRLAGQRIRKALLMRMREMIDNGITISDTYRLSLPGVDAGEITLFRIVGVDTEVVEVPYNTVGVITKWQE